MRERNVSVSDVAHVLNDPERLDQGDQPYLIHFRGSLRGRPLRITVNAFTDDILTVATDERSACSSGFGWFSFGAALEETT